MAALCSHVQRAQNQTPATINFEIIMFNQYFAGFRYAFSGMSLINTRGIRRFVVIPLLINIGVFAALIALGASYFSDLVDWLLSFLPGFLDFLRYLLWPFFVLSVLLISFYAFSVIANLLGAPFNSRLAEKVEAHLLKSQPPSSGKVISLFNAIMQSFISEFKKQLYLLSRAIPLLILFLIPGVNLIAAVLWVIYGSWIQGLEYLDYPMGNHDHTFPTVKATAADHRFLVFGFGSAIFLMTSIPLINFLAMPSGVAGGTALWVEKVRGE